MACDDWAIKSVNCHPTVYSKYLVRMAERLVPQKRQLSPVPALIRQKDELKKRVNYQMKEDVMKNVSMSKQTIIFGVMVLLFISFSWYCSKDKQFEQVMAPQSSTLMAEDGFVKFL